VNNYENNTFKKLIYRMRVKIIFSQKFIKFIPSVVRRKWG